MNKPIFIIGYPGCGKTTFGRALAKATGRDFFDLDFFIEQRFHTTVAKIFQSKGEETFRLMEKEALRELGEFENSVIACGGGTPCFFDNIGYMNSRGLTVWLTVSVKRLTERILLSPGKRPLLAGLGKEDLESHITGNLKQRSVFYEKAAIRFCGENLEDRHQIDSTVSRFIGMHADSETSGHMGGGSAK